MAAAGAASSWGAFLIAVALLGTPFAAANARAVGAAATYEESLGIGLETWPHPYPVNFSALTVAGRPVRMRYTDVPPARFANGRPIVLMHGKNFDSSHWGGAIRALMRNGYRVVVRDQFGLNTSSKPQIDYSFDMLATNAAQSLDALGLAEVDVLAHSTGGMLAVRFARTYLGPVRRLVLEDRGAAGNWVPVFLIVFGLDVATALLAVFVLRRLRTRRIAQSETWLSMPAGARAYG